MSKLQKCMYQVHEFVAFAAPWSSQASEFSKQFVRCTVGLCCAAVLAGCGARDPGAESTKSPAPPGGQILRRGLPGEPRTLDPQLADDTYSFQVIRDTYEGLTSESRSGTVLPGVASSWQVDPTGKIYTFTLRDAKWSNGDPIIASEFVDGLRKAVDPETASGSAAMLNIIRGASEVTAGRKKPEELGVQALGDLLLQIELEHPAPYVLEILSQPIAAPLHSTRLASSPRSDTKTVQVITHGPYVLTSRMPGSVIELTKNPQYWDLEHVAIERVRYLNSESEATEERKYEAEQLDMTFTLPMPDLKRVVQKYGSQVQTAPILATLYLALNLSKAPMKDKTGLRQALSMAIDRDLIADHVMTGVTPAYSFVADGINEYSPPQYAWRSWTREKRLEYAKKLFAREGYSNKNPLHLKVYFNRDEGLQRLMIAIASSWKQNLGVECELLTDEFRVFLAGRKDRNRWDVARLGWTADYNDPSSFLDVFASGNTQNDPGYASKGFDSEIGQAELEADPEKRSKLLHNAEQILLDDYPIIPIYFYNSRRLVRTYVGGASITPMNRTYTKHLYWQGEH
jgi:oligopeptide transport system substrate-binding protein